jgi:hypothetical protein
MKQAFSKITLVLVCFLVMPAYPWQDDLDINLRHPGELFPRKDGVHFFDAALAEVRIGRYIYGSKNHVWRGGVLGDVAFIRTSTLLWHMSLVQETLIDDQNDIYFRLVEAYYQALIGVKWRLGPGAFHLGFRHRCAHGLDNAVLNRITIKSGPLASYAWAFSLHPFEFIGESGINAYVFGQNGDLENQPKGNGFFVLKGIWPIKEYFQLIMASGVAMELLGRGNNSVYGLFDSWERVRFSPLVNGRLALRFIKNGLKTDIALQFSQNIDSALSERTDKTSTLLLGADFLW